MKKWLRYTVLILLLWLLFVILCLVVPPLFHKEAGYGPGRMQKEIALVRRNGFSVLMIIKRL